MRPRGVVVIVWVLGCSDPAAGPTDGGGSIADARPSDATTDAGGSCGSCGPGRCVGDVCECPFGFAGDACERCADGFHADGAACLPDDPGTANYPLEIIQPRAGLDGRNRFYKAYPGLEFVVRAAVIGGVYPYSFALLDAPDGMTIELATGTVRWPSPVEAGSPHVVTLEVTDGAGTRVSVAWTVTVTAEGFRFLDAERGATVAEGGTGAIDRPWRTLADMYEGTDPDAKYRDAYSDEFLYFASGTYRTGDAFLEDVNADGTGRLPLTGGNKPLVWLALPGERPVLDLSRGAIVIYGGSDNTYFDGFDVVAMTNYLRKGIDMEPGDDITIRRCAFSDLPEGGIGGSNNQSAIMISNSGGQRGARLAFMDNTFRSIDAYAIIAYTTDRVLFEDNDLEDFDAGFPVVGPKIDNSMWFIRHNTLRSMRGVRAVWLNNGGDTSDQEVSFNLVVTPDAEAALSVNQEAPGSSGPLHVFRNTFVGDVAFLRVASGDGPFRFYENVVVSPSGEAFACEECGDASRVEAADNLAGTPADGIVDADGTLIGASAALCGSRGHAISCP